MITPCKKYGHTSGRDKSGGCKECKRLWSLNKYSTDEEYRNKRNATKNAARNEKYAEDEEYRATIRKEQAERYATDAVFRSKVKKGRDERRSDPMVYAADLKKAREYHRSRAETDVEWVEKERIRKREHMRKFYAEAGQDYRDSFNAWRQDKYDNDPNYKLNVVLRARLAAVLKETSKSVSSMDLVGCDVDTLREHLEDQFEEGMTWENHGVHGWHIDHIVPLSKFDLADPIAQRVACNYKNLQPLWAFDNLSKGNKLPEGLI